MKLQLSRVWRGAKHVCKTKPPLKQFSISLSVKLKFHHSNSMTLQRFRLKFQNPKFACRCAQPDKNHIRTRVRAHVVRTRVRAHVVRTRVRAHVVRTCVRPHVPSAKILISNSLSDSHVQQRWRTSIPDARSYPGSAVHSPMMLFAPVSQPITCSIIG